MENKIKNQNILSQISNIVPKYCDKCGKKYSHTDLDLIEQTDNRLVCKLSCNNCRNIYILQIHKDMDGNLSAKRTNIKQELVDEQEIKKFEEMEAIDLDEVLDVYIVLEKIKDVHELLSLIDIK
ncbi:MAG: hypothetical protein KatS3mg085_020 [Candidatus Dojkabacteria bacterium]|nr:MAG: hypothetical protein KatS3mg085_020 [Candidatus Dojkabacteria bacterium]GIW58924.1 MAG: hypothetical protein KatS3mg086_209 [Candidatus Dojkabacteria bacterium]